MESLDFASGDKIEPVTDISNDDKNEKDNKILLPIEECGDKTCTEALIENSIIQRQDSIVLSIKEDRVEYPNINYTLDSNTKSDENIQIKEVCSSITYDKSTPDITDRIKECKNVIASLKFELYDEKNKVEQEYHYLKPEPEVVVPRKETNSGNYLTDLSYPTNFFTASVDTKLYSDRNLIEYEKQLQKYQRTLNMAQNAKKNAIRKQMLAKAFKLKLLEVENQCNIELLRIKQNLQCLEPLKMIAETWKTGKDSCDSSKYDLMPLFPEIYVNSGNGSISADGPELRQTILKDE